ncbi:MAG: beta-N-acetylhexosaminidase [Pseudomonadota bacterium]
MSIGPLMIDLESRSLSQEDKRLLQHPLVGGVIYFSRNYDSVEQIQQLSQEIRTIRPDILLAVDQEGGRVQRFKEGFTRIPAMQRFLPLYRKNPEPTLAMVKDAAWLMASELLAVGIDFSFAPVLDVDDKQCKVIADRSFSPDPAEVSLLGDAWIKGMHDAGMATTAKHFPGHGSVATDSHKTLPIDKRAYAAIESHDLIPFVERINQVDALMPAHILFTELDDKYPVGFSRYWLQTILREQLNFKGVIFSDDLSMEAAALGGSYIERTELAISAGCDMVLICNNRPAVVEVLNGLSISMNDQSVERLRKMRARAQISWAQLSAHSRWQLAKQLLQVINH